MGRDPLAIFPGFELEAHVGKGIHVLCLFPENCPLPTVEAVVTTFGLPPHSRFRNGEPQPSSVPLVQVLKEVQKAQEWPGLVVAAHAHSDKGLFDDDKAFDWLQQREFTNPDLLCLEVPRPVEQLSKNFRALLGNGPDCHPDWQRSRKICCIMSSDCYALEANEQSQTNFIGWRSTWIKMSHPSIEALRQAFIDNESRVRLQDKSPDLAFDYPRLQSVRIKGGTFIRGPLQVDFSPKLNCIIGSRGTGKSTLFDYVRMALDRIDHDDIPALLRDEIGNRVHKTLTVTGEIEVTLATRGGTYRIVYRANDSSRKVYLEGVDSSVDVDVRTLFPCRILSQREIDHIAGGKEPAALNRFLDDFVRVPMEAVNERERSTRATIEILDKEIAKKQQSVQRRVVLETQRLDLEQTARKLEQASETLGRWRSVESERAYFERVESLTELVSGSLPTQVPLPIDVPLGAMNSSLLNEANVELSQALVQLRVEIDSASARFRSRLSEPSSVFHTTLERWRTIHQAIQNEMVAIEQSELAEGGSSFSSLTIPARIDSINQLLAQIEVDAKELATLREQREQQVKVLRSAWEEQTALRDNIATTIMRRLTLEHSKPLVEIQVRSRSNRRQFQSFLSRFIVDGRKLSEGDISTVLDSLDDAGKDAPIGDLFVELVCSTNSRSRVQVLLPRRVDAFFEAFNPDIMSQVELYRGDDEVSYLVRRKDGSLAGPLQSVSAGQQGTAILNMLLASGTDPLFVDTPEEGLDSEGVYHELVPLFRLQKEYRQVVVVTHNANIPVIGDAEHIFPMEASGYIDTSQLVRINALPGMGITAGKLEHLRRLVGRSNWEAEIRDYLSKQSIQVTTIQEVLTQILELRVTEGQRKHVMLGRNSAPAYGALDEPRIKKAVQDVMEGSEKAFKQRQEMYGF